MSETSQAEIAARFSGIHDWVFDLDNTLYPHHIDLHTQIGARMTDYVSSLLGLAPEEAWTLQRQYYLDHGLTLLGLMADHGIDPLDYLEKTHAIDYSALQPQPGLAAALAALPGRKFIFTNASRGHADAVATALGLSGLFDGVFDLVAAGYAPKPTADSYRKFLEGMGVDAHSAAMFEDLPRNLDVPHSLGMVTVLIIPSAQEKVPIWWDSQSTATARADFVTDDLAGFLAAIVGTSQT
ncbi:pyrimidine 5'-nucleotidase [Labrys miyagiensis]|nr:pyrimidine 5'-nucleotidase [Labrys miyagiensis]